MTEKIDSADIERFTGLDAYTLADSARRVGTGGAIEILRPQNGGTTFVGRALTARVQYEPNKYIPREEYGAGRLLERIGANDVLVLDVGGLRFTALGDLAIAALERRGAAAAVVHGCVRDIEHIDPSFPVFAVDTALTSIAGHGFVTDIGEAVSICGVRIATGDLVAGCRGGVVAIPWTERESVFAEASLMIERDSRVLEGIQKGEAFGSVSAKPGKPAG